MFFVFSLSNLLASHSLQLLSFVFLFLLVSWNSCPHYHLLVAYATPKKEAENPDFIRLLGQSLTNDLACIYAVFGNATRLLRATIQFGILARIITSWLLMRPRKKRLKIPILFAYWVKA